MLFSSLLKHWIIWFICRYAYRAVGEALEVIPRSLAHNCGAPLRYRMRLINMSSTELRGNNALQSLSCIVEQRFSTWHVYSCAKMCKGWASLGAHASFSFVASVLFKDFFGVANWPLAKHFLGPVYHFLRSMFLSVLSLFCILTVTASQCAYHKRVIWVYKQTCAQRHEVHSLLFGTSGEAPKTTSRLRVLLSHSIAQQVTVSSYSTDHMFLLAVFLPSYLMYLNVTICISL